MAAYNLYILTVQVAVTLPFGPVEESSMHD